MRFPDLRRCIAAPVGEATGAAEGRHERLLRELESGQRRAAYPNDEGHWQVDTELKREILDAFRTSEVRSMPTWGPCFDKSAFPPRRLERKSGVRLVPGGSAIRRGAHVAPGVVVMPPAYINVGAWVGEGTMIDSHALVGSCAQIGCRVHLSAGVQVGGVLEPVSARPVVIEDDVFVGGLCGLFEGILVRRGAVIAAGVTLTASTPLHDLVHRRIHRREVPAGAVVVPGCRPASGEWAAEAGLGVQTPIIVKYRDPSTDGATALEDALR